MPKPIDVLGMGPTRHHVRNENGTYTLTVTPPRWSKFAPSKITLNERQFQNYIKWRAGGGLIQDYFPELSDRQREILLSGIGEDLDFDDDE